MRLSYNTDSLGHLPFEEMLDTVRAMGVESVEVACGNWSQAPHMQLDDMLASADKRKSFLDAITSRGMTLEALNCSGNQLDPDQGAAHQAVVEKTFQLASLLGVDKIIMMSGLPGGSPEDKTANWITTSWPPSVVKILDWQWRERLIPYWMGMNDFAKKHGVKRIALENHGSQMVYSPESYLRLREAVGPLIGMNLDPSHMMWMGAEPIEAARFLGKEHIYHVHAKDVRIERGLGGVHGMLDTKTIDKFENRTWNFVALGYGKDTRWWTEFLSVLSMIGYDDAVSLEMEDMTMDPLVGVIKSFRVLKEAFPRIID